MKYMLHLINNKIIYKFSQMKKFLIIISIFTFTWASAQVEVRKNSLSTGGGSSNVGTTHLVFTIGEIAVQENTQSSIHVSEGFIGPDIAQLLGIEDYASLEGVHIFPNPVKSTLNVNIPNQEGNYSVYLFDLQGKILMSKSVDSDFQLNMSTYPTAVYLLSIIDNQQKRKSIIKVQKE